MRMRPSYLGFLLASAVLPFTLVGSGRTKGVAVSDEAERGKSNIVARAKAEEETAPFRFPDDEGGRLLSRLLAPPQNLPPQRTTEPRRRPTPKPVENPAPSPPPVVLLPRLTTEGTPRTPPPQLLAPELPLGGHDTPVVIPTPPSFPVGERLRVPSIDVEQPSSLSPMAQPLPDRAAVADPTLPASREAILTATMPERKNPAPFLRLMLPDPFEHRDTVRFRKSLGEEQVPVLFPTRPPQR